MYDNRYWICINGFNGYEYSNDGLLRSMKNFKVNPTGKLIRKYKDKKGYYYFLSDNNNKRKKVYEYEIQTIVKSDPNPRIRRTYETDIDSRNRIMASPSYNKPKIDLTKQVKTNYMKILDKAKPEKIKAIYFY